MKPKTFHIIPNIFHRKALGKTLFKNLLCIAQLKLIQNIMFIIEFMSIKYSQVLKSSCPIIINIVQNLIHQVTKNVPFDIFILHIANS